MKSYVQTFARREDGAVTADWVVLSALVVTLLAAGYGQVESGTKTLATKTENYMTSYDH